jgi:sortase, srtB family
MSDLFKESAADNALEAKLRAEKIGKIKNSVQNSGESEWEKEIAERIARKVQNVKANKNMDAIDILNELDAQNRSRELHAETDKPPIRESIPERINVNEQADTVVPDEIAPTRNILPEAEKLQEKIPEQAPEKLESPADAEPIKAPSGKKKKKKKKKKKTFKERFLGLFPQKGDSVLECIRKIVFLISIIAIIVCGYMVADYYLDLWNSKKINDQVMEMYWTYEDEDWTPPAPESDDTEEVDNRPVYHMLSGARKLLDINSDVVGVISIPDTEVNNPVMQASDNFKYLDLKINGDESRAGELFLDYRNHFDDVDAEGHLKYPNSDNLVIYGHNMGDETMFGTLKYYQRNDDYYGKHPVIELNSNYCRYTYKIFSFFILDADDKSDTKFDCWNKLNFEDEKDFYNFVNEAKRRTLRLNNVDVEYGDKLLTLSTCNTLLGDRGRLIILARLVREGEDPLEGTQDSVSNPNIKWPSIYYDYKEISPTYDPNAEFVPYGPAESDKKKTD